MSNLKAVSLAVFAASFLAGFLIFQANKAVSSQEVSMGGVSMQLSMVPLFSSSTGSSEGL